MKYNGFVVPEDCEKAIKKLLRLAVEEVKEDDQEENFSDVWWHVQHECDLYEEDPKNEEGCTLLKRGSYNSAKKWLDEYEHLFKKYEKE